jgi:hypothetical protein
VAARSGGAKAALTFPAAEAQLPSAADERLNDQIHSLMRTSAEERESRTQAVASENIAAARRQFEDVIALARAEARKSR